MASLSPYPDFSFENQYDKLVAGVDEVGRGPWAGPVVAAAVILPKNNPLPEGIHDSKQLSHAKREMLYEILTSLAVWHIGIASVEEIDRMNILNATMCAMQRAVEGLHTKPGVALVDGNRAPHLSCKVETLVKGDQRSLSIAAASIIAKVTRDRMMVELSNTYPMYGWDSNAGYGTKLHQEGLRTHGITEHHRKSFAPIKALLQGNAA